MIRLFINGVAASAGGGLTYLRNVIPHLASRSDCQTTLLSDALIRSEFEPLPNVSFIEISENTGVMWRFIREQAVLPKLILRSASQVLVSAGNFALWNCPVPQILLSRNSLYTSSDFLRDVRGRGDYALWVDTVIKGWLARQSISRADIALAPSEAFATELRSWSGRNVLALHHGFDAEAFAADTTPLPSHAMNKIEGANDSLRLLFVSHYNYYRNFETLFRAIPILSMRLKKKVKLFLTCRLKSEANPGTYRTEAASSLADDLRGGESIVELGTMPYRSLHHLYRACHVYVSPAYAESFAHPLIEAMSSGLPVVASDLPVHREICGDAGLYFSRFSPDDLAEQVTQIHKSPELAKTLSRNGLRRANEFSWREHVDRLVVLAQKLVQSESERN